MRLLTNYRWVWERFAACKDRISKIYAAISTVLWEQKIWTWQIRCHRRYAASWKGCVSSMRSACPQRLAWLRKMIGVWPFVYGLDSFSLSSQFNNKLVWVWLSCIKKTHFWVLSVPRGEFVFRNHPAVTKHLHLWKVGSIQNYRMIKARSRVF